MTRRQDCRMTIHHWGVLSASKQHRFSFLLKCHVSSFYSHHFWGAEDQKATAQSCIHCVQTVQVWLQTCRHSAHTINYQCINHDNTTPSACVCYLCMHECNLGRVIAYWYPLSYWSWKRRVLLLQHLLSLLLSILGKCLSFSEYLCILWHDTEVKLCRALWSCNTVDMGSTPVWGFDGVYPGPCEIIELLDFPCCLCSTVIGVWLALG